MTFQPGQSGNPLGRPKGTKSGRVHALGELDAMLSDDSALETLREGFQKALERDPVWFFRRIIIPLLPKEASLQIENAGAIQWVSLSTTIPTEVSNASMMPAINASALSAPDDDLEKPSA